MRFREVDPRELGQEKYLQRVVERLVAAIHPDDDQGEPPLMPILNRYSPYGSTENVDFKTTKRCFVTTHSHINLVAADTARWEQSTAFRLEQAAIRGIIKFYARNDQLGFHIPYEFLKVKHNYTPDFLVKLSNDATLILEVKGLETEEDRAKHEAAKRWVRAVNNWAKMGLWRFHVIKDPQVLLRELQWMVSAG